jgi:hypothetical protein
MTKEKNIGKTQNYGDLETWQGNEIRNKLITNVM